MMAADTQTGRVVRKKIIEAIRYRTAGTRATNSRIVTTPPVHSGVSSSPAAVITFEAGCSITSATGRLIRRAAFFTGVRCGLALATVRFLACALAALRALPRLAEFPLRNFARFCTFDSLLRLAMIDPLIGAAQSIDVGSKSNWPNGSGQVGIGRCQLGSEADITARSGRR
jgi:hypothetical protein